MVVQTQQTADKLGTGGNFKLAGQVLEGVDSFKYLGSTQNNRGNLDSEVDKRCTAMLQAFGRFRHVFRDRRVEPKTRLSLFNVIIVPTGYYGCQTWNLTVAHIRELESVYFRLLRKILDVKEWRTPFTELIKHARRWNKEFFPLECRIRQAQLRYFGHLVRSGEQEPTREVAYAYIAGPAKRGGKFSDFQGDLAEALDLFNIEHAEWEKLACTSNKSQWRKLLCEGMNVALENWATNRLNADNDAEDPDNHVLEQQ
jgi:hypothetical protein